MTSINENRQSNEAAQASIQLAKTANLQNRNIKLFTIITIFFLPLGYVTSVYGMNNMPMDGPFYPFAYTTIAICLPTYVLMGLLWPTNPIETWNGWFRKGKSKQESPESPPRHNQKPPEPPEPSELPEPTPGLKHRVKSDSTRRFASMFTRMKNSQLETNGHVNVPVDASTKV